MKTFQEIIVSDSTVILVLLQDTTIVGQVGFSSENSELFNLYVDIKHRGIGNAELLLREAIFRYQPKYITASSCYGSNVEKLISLYTKVGFCLDNVRLSYGSRG